MEAKEFGKYLKSLRNERNLTLTQLGDLVGYSNPYLSQIENGKKGIPSPELLRKLSGPLGERYENLMIKAGYWTYKESKEDRALFEEIHQNTWDLNNKIISLLKLIAEDDGLFPEYLHKDIFNIFGTRLTLSDGNRPSYDFDQWYSDEYLTKGDDEISERTFVETTDHFNRIYNYSTIKEGIINYKGYTKDREYFLNGLIELMNKHGLTTTFNEGGNSELPLKIELTEILNTLSTTAILYKGKLLDIPDRVKVLAMLEVLFDEKLKS